MAAYGDEDSSPAMVTVARTDKSDMKRLRSSQTMASDAKKLVCEKEFRGAVAALRHENLVPLRAYFYSEEEKLLVYDSVAAAGLSSLLHGTNAASGAGLNFTARARIALASAGGVAFIHGAGAGSIHGNIKSSNVLVTDVHDGAYVTDHCPVQLGGAATDPGGAAN